MGWLISPVGYWFLGSLLLAAPQPGTPWYKHSSSPRYHTVGRASGLLIGVRRSPYSWRRDLKADSIPGGQQGAEEGTGVIRESWRGTEHQLYPDPGESRRFLEKLISESMQRSLEEERSLNEVKRTLQDEKSQEQGRWKYNEPEEDRSPEDQSWITNYPGDEERSLEEEMMTITEPGEERRTLEESWVTDQPGEVGGSLEGEKWKFGQPVVETRSLDRDVWTHQESGQDRRPSREDTLSMFLKLHLQGKRRSHPQPWTTQTRTDKQPLYSKSKTSEWVNCEDFALTSYNVLCRASLRFLSHSQPQPRRPRPEAKEPTTPL